MIQLSLALDLESAAGERVERIPTDLIDADPGQPRREFDPEHIRALKESIVAVGLQNPLLVEATPDGRYRLVTGECRLRAIRLAALEHPGDGRFQTALARVIRPGSLTRAERLALQLSENEFRSELSVRDTAEALKALRDALAEERARRLLPDADGLDRSGLEVALAERRMPWPEPAWDDVLAFAGVTGGRRWRIKRILALGAPVLERCAELGLTESAAAEVEGLGEERALALLEAAGRVGDPSVVTPAATLMRGDPGLAADDAVRMVLAGRRAAQASRSAVGAPPGQTALPRPPMPADVFEGVISALRAAAESLDTYGLDEYRRGSVRLLLERIRVSVEGADYGA